VVWRRRAISTETLWPGSWPPSPGFEPCAILIWSSSANAAYSGVTPKRPDAICFIRELRSVRNRDGSSPPSPQFERARSRLNAQHGEVVARHHLGGHALGLVAHADRRRHQPPADDFRQRLRPLLVVLIDRIRVHPCAHVAAVVVPLLIEHHQLLGVLHGQFAEEHLIEQREDGGVRAYPQGQGQDSDDREQGAAAKPAQRQAEIGEYRTHRALRREGGDDRWQEKQTLELGSLSVRGCRPADLRSGADSSV